MASTARSRGPLEREIQEQVTALLQFDGWRAFRTELTVQRERGRVVGEGGQPDYLYLRYDRPGFAAGNAEVIWVEYKRGKFGKLSQAQKFWHLAERQRGALVWVIGSVDEFMKLYDESGLKRRAFLMKARTA